MGFADNFLRSSSQEINVCKYDADCDALGKELLNRNLFHTQDFILQDSTLKG